MSLIGPKTKPKNSWESHLIGCKIIKWVSISYNRTPSCDSVSWVTMTTSHHCASAILYRTRGKWLDKILVNFWIYTRMRSLLTSKLRIRRKPKRWHSHPSQVVDNPSHKHTCIACICKHIDLRQKEKTHLVCTWGSGRSWSSRSPGRCRRLCRRVWCHFLFPSSVERTGSVPGWWLYRPYLENKTSS